jgi:hypothetical protein
LSGISIAISLSFLSNNQIPHHGMDNSIAKPFI